MKQGKTLGILGGMGPMASVYFYELLTAHTAATRDQEHLNILLSSHPNTPDRTAFLLGENKENPAPAMQGQAQLLERAGAEVLAIACNTAHCFYEELSAAVSIPILHMPRLVVAEVLAQRGDKLGILATQGTLQVGLYQKECAQMGLDCVVPSKHAQEGLMQVIYEDIKASRSPRIELFSAAADELLSSGCTHLILGCTELSLLKRAGACPPMCLDGMDVLAKACILACGHTPQNFEF